MQTGARRHWCVCVSVTSLSLNLSKSILSLSKAFSFNLRLDTSDISSSFCVSSDALQRSSCRPKKKIKNKIKKWNANKACLKKKKVFFSYLVRSLSCYILCADIPKGFLWEEKIPPPPARTNTPAAASPPWRWVSPCDRPNTSPGPESSPPEPPPGRSTHSPAKRTKSTAF